MTDIQQQVSFEERMMGRIRESIGDLMTDDDLKKIVERGVHKAFFEPTKRTDGYRTIEEDPKILSVLRGLLIERVRGAVDDWVTRNPEKVETILADMMREGLARIILQQFESKFSTATFQFQNEVQRILGQNS